ncbi:DUF2501 domain-containing protein [Dyella sedimenti]|uniref:DUF2501 domain-containing protein n=1 Tax=Dyella sedimenti TaxID=2919947 RepID=UPI001FAAAD6B|nr:DUF2501 domain-containing protein [Dyella sedimenti]
MNKRIGGITTACMAIAASLACNAGGAQDLGKLGSMIPGGGSMTSGSMGNVAGLLEYCVKNNYLGGNSGAAGIKDQLLGKMGGGSSSDGSGRGSSGAGDMLGELTGNKHKSSSGSGNPSSDPGYLNGAKGILQGSNGQTMDLNSLGGGSSDVKSKLTTKVCDTVLKQGKSFL